MQPHEKACDCQNCYLQEGTNQPLARLPHASSGFQAEERDPWASDNVTLAQMP